MSTWSSCYSPDHREGAISISFVCPSVYLSVTYIANNSRTQKPSVPKFGMKVPRLRCGSHSSFKFKRSKVRATDGWGHTVSVKPGGHTACYNIVYHSIYGLLQLCNFYILVPCTGFVMVFV